jgi:hypothetical protein
MKKLFYTFSVLLALILTSSSFSNPTPKNSKEFVSLSEEEFAAGLIEQYIKLIRIKQFTLNRADFYSDRKAIDEKKMEKIEEKIDYYLISLINFQGKMLDPKTVTKELGNEFIFLKNEKEKQSKWFNQNRGKSGLTPNQIAEISKEIEFYNAKIEKLSVYLNKLSTASIEKKMIFVIPENINSVIYFE